MSRAIPTTLVDHLQGAGTTVCFLLKVRPTLADIFGLTTLDRDVVYDDASGDGPITYRAARGYTSSDHVANSTLGVDNSEAAGLLAEYPVDGMTKEGIARGDYDGAIFQQLLVNYEDLAAGHTIINSGRVGQVRSVDNLTVTTELRSLMQVLKQKSVIEVTSIGCRAKFGDDRCKVAFVWESAEVSSVGAETDRTFVMSSLPPDFRAPGIVKWTSGANAGRESEVEEFDEATGVISLMIPTYEPIVVGDEADVRRDCDKTKAMCRDDYDNLVNMRAEPELPRADGTSLQTPAPRAS
jgi:uncharacterized phage protein (TIGR02218 family)